MLAQHRPRRRFAPPALVAVLALVCWAFLVGCSDLSRVLPPPITPDPEERPASGGGLAPGDQASWLAYIGGDGNVYATTAARTRRVQITADATARAEESGLSYHRLAWSADGRLAFAAVTRSGSNAHGKLYVTGPIGRQTAPDAASTPTAWLVAENEEHFIIYNYWSPAPCSSGSACGYLTYLIEEADGVALHLVDFDSGVVTDQRIGVGRPFYFSWSPQGDHIVWHTGGAARHNAAAAIVWHDVASGTSSAWPVEPGLFHAPAWAPDGRAWLAVIGSGTRRAIDRLQSFGGQIPVGSRRDYPAQSEVLAAAHDSRIAFAWSPDGSRVAYAVGRPGRYEEPGDTFYGPVHVWQAETGEARALTNPAFDIAGFFWSPDGQRLAYLSRLVLPDAIWMQWRTYDVDRQVDRGFAAFHPSPLMRFMIHSFNQYAQSHSVWSPDGRYLVYADRGRDLVDRVWLIDTEAPPAEGGTQPILVDEGSLGVWSWGR
jgi:TolB protein